MFRIFTFSPQTPSQLARILKRETLARRRDFLIFQNINLLSLTINATLATHRFIMACHTSEAHPQLSSISFLSSSVHGLNVQRGQLRLTDAEHQALVEALKPVGFSFVPIAEEEQPHRPIRDKRKKSFTDKQDEASRSTAVAASHVEKRPKRQKLEIAEAPPPPPVIVPPTVKQKAAGRASPSGVPTGPIRCSRRRRELLQGRWEEACELLTLKLEAEPVAHWFLTPVDPIADKVPDYLEKVKTPMDFETVKQKLKNGMYSHPFRWQEDVRTIFYNAFTYHQPGNTIWTDAKQLAELFEKLCKETEGVNPYALYDHHGISSSSRRISSNINNCVVDSPAGEAKSGLRGSSASSRAVASSVSIEGLSVKNRSDSQSADTITLNAAKLRELLEKAASAAVAQQQMAECKPEETATAAGLGKNINDPSSLLNVAASTSWINNKSGRVNNHNHTIESKGAAPPSARTAFSQASAQPSIPGMKRLLPQPTMPDPPAPPVTSAIKPGEKPPNVVHKRLVAAQLRDLDVHYRKAVRESGVFWV